MDELEGKVVNISSPHDGRLAASWGGGNSLWVYMTPGIKGDAENRDLTIPPMVRQLTMDVDFQNATTRRLINETHGIFMDLQQIENAAASSRKESLVNFSRQYRSVLKACLLNLETDDNVMLQDNKEHNQVRLLSFTELVWHLCEILLIESLPGGIILQHLLEWVKWHSTTADTLTTEVAESSEPAENSNYWPAIYHLLLQGRITEVRNLLAQHSDRLDDEHDKFAIVDDLLKKMPIFKLYIGYSEFSLKWNYWQHECQSRCSHGELVSTPELMLLVQILCGDNEAFVKLKDICEDLSWYEVLIAKLLYSNPLVKSYEIQYHTKFCLELCGGKDVLETWHEILLAAIEFDVHAVIKISSECLGNWWFVAHLADIFHHSGQLESHHPHVGNQIDLREFLLLEYASSLMSHPSLWQIAADYFLHCPARGRQYLEEYIEQLPLETETKAFKVLQLCEKLDFSTQALSICKQMGMRAYQNNRLGSALSWSIRAKDPAFASFISERFTDEYFAKGEFSSFDLIDNLGASMLLCERLTFLGKYREFHMLYQNGDFGDAANLLVSLLTSNLAPKRIWLSLLTDALPLLEHDEVVFSSSQTFELMHCLEEIRLSPKWTEQNGTSGTLQGTKSKGVHKSSIYNEILPENNNVLFEPIRLALARNLSRSFLLDI